MVWPRSFMLREASSSFSTSPFSRPYPRFQYVDPGTMTPDMRNIWFIVSKACVPPPRLTATTEAPIFPRNKPPLASDTKPDRSSSAFISALTSVKYVGDPRIIASAATIFLKHGLKKSSFWLQREFFLLKHWKQAWQPRMDCPPSWTNSVSQPAAAKGTKTFLKSISVFPRLRG